LLGTRIHTEHPTYVRVALDIRRDADGIGLRRGSSQQPAACGDFEANRYIRHRTTFSVGHEDIDRVL
jgi:hypothetical protein